MLKKLSDFLVGLRVVDCDIAAGDAGLLFEGGVNLIIYNNFEVVGEPLLKGRAVTEVVESEVQVKIKFDDLIEIKIDLSDAGYTGPEAMQLVVPNERIVIWN